MKQFLRYQISGTVYILWCVVFYYGKNAENLNALASLLYLNLKDLKVIAGLAVALPVGVIIHQLSVLIKNFLIANIWKEFDDSPQDLIILKLNDEDKNHIEYCLERISNLNSFYYVRFDNGVLSPLLASLTVNGFMGCNIVGMWAWTAILIGLVTIAYIPRIHSEMKTYNSILNN